MMGAERAAAAAKKAMTALEKYKFVLLVLLAGLLLLLLPLPSGGGETAHAGEAEQAATAFSVDELEEKLEATLSRIDGAGEVTVALTLRSGARQVLAQDVTVSDREGSSGEERTTVVQTLAPQFQGALVVCPGGDDPTVRLKLAEAVADLTGLGADRISICKGK